MVCKRRIGRAELDRNPKLRPVRITAGALGPGLPARDLWLSRQHRLAVTSPICRRMFAQEAVLIAAIKLTEVPGIYVDLEIPEVEYYHLLLRRHEVIYAENTPTESLYLGEGTLHAMSQEAREELDAIFRDLARRTAPPESALFIPEGRRQKRLVARHLKNAKPFVA